MFEQVSGEVSILSLEDLSEVKVLGAGGDDGMPSSVPSGRKTSSMVARGPVRVCRFSPDGKVLAVGYDSGDVEVSKKQKQGKEMVFPTKTFSRYIRRCASAQEVRRRVAEAFS